MALPQGLGVAGRVADHGDDLAAARPCGALGDGVDERVLRVDGAAGDDANPRPQRVQATSVDPAVALVADQPVELAPEQDDVGVVRRKDVTPQRDCREETRQYLLLFIRSLNSLQN